MHGSLLRARCLRCDGACDWAGDLSTGTACPACLMAGGMRPDIVWFGEVPLELERIGRALDRCTLFVAIGTSGQVYPAAGFVAEVAERALTIELNLEPSDAAPLFDETRAGRATETVPALVRDLLAGRG